MPYVGGLAIAFQGRNGGATEAALKAAAQVVVNGLKDEKPLGVRGGFTSGAFVTGNLLGSIDMTDVVRTPEGPAIAVYTDAEYAVYWEYGHFNIFSRKYEREERWEPTLRRVADEANAAFARTYRRFMGG